MIVEVAPSSVVFPLQADPQHRSDPCPDNDALDNSPVISTDCASAARPCGGRRHPAKSKMIGGGRRAQGLGSCKGNIDMRREVSVDLTSSNSISALRSDSDVAHKCLSKATSNADRSGGSTHQRICLDSGDAAFLRLAYADSSSTDPMITWHRSGSLLRRAGLTTTCWCAGCGPEVARAPTGYQVARSDSAGVELVVSTGIDALPQWKLESTPILSIGAVEAPRPEASHVAGALVLPDSSILISDQRPAAVRRFASTATPSRS